MTNRQRDIYIYIETQRERAETVTERMRERMGEKGKKLERLVETEIESER